MHWLMFDLFYRLPSAMTQILPDETFPQFNAGTNFNIVNGGMVSQVNPNAGKYLNIASDLHTH